jgi:hypothetical protein
MTTYLALSTINYQQNGYTIYAESSNKAEAKEKAEAHLIKNESGVYLQTLQTNLQIVSKSASKKFRISGDVNDPMFGQY